MSFSFASLLSPPSYLSWLIDSGDYAQACLRIANGEGV